MGDPNRAVSASRRPKAIVRLLDFQQIEIVLHSRLSVEDVLRLVSEKLELSFSDSQYFCLGFTDNLNHFHWLDGSVILYDLVASTSNPKGTLTLSHHVRFFVDTIYEVQCASTAKLFFFDIHNQLTRHELLVASEDYFELVAILVSVFVLDCQEHTIAEVISRVMPLSHPPYILLKTDQSDVEKKVFEKFRYYRRLPVGTGMISFIKLAEKSESYGYRMYEALNENNDKCILSIGYKGIYIYRRSRHQNLITPYLAYPWRVIDNLYYRDKMFSIEIREPKKTESSENVVDDVILINDRQLSEAFSHPTTQVSCGRRRSNNQQPRVLLFPFTCATPLVCRTVWMSAIAQHRFFLERKELKKQGKVEIIANDQGNSQNTVSDADRLKTLLKTAKVFLGNNVNDAVITVPAYLNESQREATKNAGAISGLNVLRVIKEPAAVAHSYAFNMVASGERNIVIVDMSAKALSSYVFVVKDLDVSVKSDLTKLNEGGDELTTILSNKIMEGLHQKYHNRWFGSDTYQQIRRECERAVKSLCRLDETTIYVNRITENDDLYMTVDLKYFNSMIESMRKRFIEFVNLSMSDAKMDKRQIHDVMFVGEFSHLPKLRSTLSDIFFGKELNKSINPDEAVAHGAAIIATIISGDKSEAALLPPDIDPLSLSEETAKDNNLFGRFALSRIPPAPRGVTKIEVTFDIDANGILNFSATDKSTGKHNKITITNDRRRVSEDEIVRMVNQARKIRIAAKESLLSYIHHVKHSIEDEKLKDKISPDDKKKWLGGNQTAEKEEFEHQRKELEQLALPIICKAGSSVGGAPPGAGAPGAAGGAGGPTVN